MLKTEKLEQQLGSGGKGRNSRFGVWCFKLLMVSTTESVRRYLSLQLPTNQQDFVTTTNQQDFVMFVFAFYFCVFFSFRQ